MKTSVIKTKHILTLLAVLVALLGSTAAQAAQTAHATSSGNWNTNGTWNTGVVPVAGDTVIIDSGVTVTLTAAAACATLTVDGTLAANNAITVSGATLFTSTGAYTCGAISGTRTFTGDVQLDAGSTWASVSAGPCSFGGNLVNNATSFSGNGTYTFTGVSKTISGATTTALTALSVSGSYTSSGTVTVSGTLTLAGTLLNNGTFLFGAASGSGTLTQGAGANLTFTQNNGGAPSFTIAATASGNTVTYSGSGPAVKATTYQNLTFSYAGTGSSYAWNNTIVVSGTLTAGGNTGSAINNVQGTFGAIVENGAKITCSAAITISGNLIVSSGTFYAQSGLLTVSGTTTVNGGTLQLGNNAAFTGDVSINSGTTWSNSGNGTVSFAGNFAVSGGTFSSGTGTNTFSGTSKTIAGTMTIPKMTVIGTITNAGTLTVSAALAGSGTLTQGANSTLSIGGTSASLNLAASANTPNTVNYTGANQTVYAASYFNLGLTGSGSDPIGAGVSVAGTLTIKGPPTANLSIPLTVAGLTLATTPQAAGTTYGGTGTTAVNKSATYFATGTGANYVTVTSANPTPTFSGVSSKIIIYGAASVSLSGTISATGPVYPENGSRVTASINGHAVNGVVTDTSGNFSITYNDASLATDGVGSSPYAITYSFAGDAHLAAAVNDTSTALTVNPLAITATGSKLYDGAATINAANLTVGDAVNGDTVNFDSGSGTLASASGGLQMISSFGTLALGNNSSGDYTLAGANGSVRINPAPGVFTMATTSNTPASFNTSKLTLVASDAGVTLSVTGVSAVSTQGGTATLAGSTITYTPESTYVGADSFTYTLSDDAGGSSTGTVNVTVNAINASSTITDIVVTNGVSATLTASGIPDQTYYVQYSDDLSHWTTLEPTAQAAANGVIIYTDYTSDSSRYYRLAQYPQ